MHVTYFSVYTRWTIQRGYRYGEFPSVPKNEKVTTWYPNRLLFQHFSSTTKNPAHSEIAFDIWLPPQMKEIAATQGHCRQV